MIDNFTEEELRELATVFNSPATAGLLLEQAGLTRARHPGWQDRNPHDFWRAVGALLQHGIIAGGHRRVLAAASRLYPANRILARRAPRNSATFGAPGRGHSSAATEQGSGTRNEISGGTFHGPVIQVGNISVSAPMSGDTARPQNLDPDTRS